MQLPPQTMMAHYDAIAAIVSQVTHITGLMLQTAYRGLLREDKVNTTTTARTDWACHIGSKFSQENIGNWMEAAGNIDLL